MVVNFIDNAMRKDFFEPGVVYHIFNRGNNKEDIFKEDKNYFYFLSLVEKYLLPIAEIYAYCLLKNHFHFVVRIKDIDLLEAKYKEKLYVPFSNLFNAYTKAINKSYNRSGSLFQEHLRRKRIENEAELMQLIAYVHLNQMKHGLSDDFRNYRYSSYKAYTSANKTNVSCEYVVSLFGDIDNFEYWHNTNRLNLEDQIDDI